ncbi:MAG: hypothetical protein D6786_01380 [Gammaproteobacteria bacterium]|nr:MAG: hypothetical protein D6786_01380 [Gammaproteobacteria bacterium]
MKREPPRRNALPPGSMLLWYRIDGVLGQGGFGITYLAWDTNLGHAVAIKEYLPSSLATRDQDSQVHPLGPEAEAEYQWGLQRFLEEARTLARFRHPAIIRVYSVFEANNTACMVMEYEQGRTLRELIRQQGRLDEQQVRRLLEQLLDGLEQVHAHGFIHRDIKPDNIYLRDDGSPLLLDFGSARQALGLKTRSLTTIVSPGFAPFEQYQSDARRQGPWSDIYSLAATFYFAISGRAPADATDRSHALHRTGRDPLVPLRELAGEHYDASLVAALDHALAFHEEERPRNIGQWREELCLDATEAPPSRPAQISAPGAVPEESPEIRLSLDEEDLLTRRESPVLPGHSTRPWLLLLLLVILGGLGFLYREWLPGQPAPPVTGPETRPGSLPAAPVEGDDVPAREPGAASIAPPQGTAEPPPETGAGGVVPVPTPEPVASLAVDGDGTPPPSTGAMPGYLPPPPTRPVRGPAVTTAPPPGEREAAGIRDERLAAVAPGDSPQKEEAPLPATGTGEPVSKASRNAGVTGVQEERPAAMASADRPPQKPPQSPSPATQTGESQERPAAGRPDEPPGAAPEPWGIGVPGTVRRFGPAEVPAGSATRDLLPETEPESPLRGGPASTGSPPTGTPSMAFAHPGPPPSVPVTQEAAVGPEPERPAQPGEQGVRRDRLSGGEEGPPWVTVRLSSGPLGFALHEVTRGEFAEFVQATGYVTEAERDGRGCRADPDGDGRWRYEKGTDWRRPGFAQDERHPVVCVSWNDARAFLEWLSRQTGSRYRLPTEQEWGEAAAAGTAADRFWGDDAALACRYANVADRSLAFRYPRWITFECDDHYLHTSPAGRFLPNGFGLHDMLGNVQEWSCSPWAERPGPAARRCAREDEPRRVRLGGSWSDPPATVRLDHRDWSRPATRTDYLGFRFVREITGTGN